MTNGDLIFCLLLWFFLALMVAAGEHHLEHQLDEALATLHRIETNLERIQP